MHFYVKYSFGSGSRQISYLQNFEMTLRYYATFKVKKFEWLFYKTNTFAKKLPLALDCGQSKYS